MICLFGCTLAAECKLGCKSRVFCIYTKSNINGIILSSKNEKEKSI